MRDANEMPVSPLRCDGVRQLGGSVGEPCLIRRYCGDREAVTDDVSEASNQ
jgi:hypothetical protein